MRLWEWMCQIFFWAGRGSDLIGSGIGADNPVSTIGPWNALERIGTHRKTDAFHSILLILIYLFLWNALERIKYNIFMTS